MGVWTTEDPNFPLNPKVWQKFGLGKQQTGGSSAPAPGYDENYQPGRHHVADPNNPVYIDELPGFGMDIYSVQDKPPTMRSQSNEDEIV